jgi:glycosyltransferase involved in cell wall biosynthesis
LKRLYAEADIFVLPTKADFAPTNAVCEAMAMRLPIITTRVGGLDEVVRDGESGFVVPPGNADLLAERITTLVHNPAMRRQFGDRGREIVEERFNLTKTAGQIVTLLCAAADGAHVHGRATARGERQ